MGCHCLKLIHFRTPKVHLKSYQTSVEDNKKSILKIKPRLKVKILHSFSLYVLGSSPQHCLVGLHSKPLNLRYSLKEILKMSNVARAGQKQEEHLLMWMYFGKIALQFTVTGRLFKGELRTTYITNYKLEWIALVYAFYKHPVYSKTQKSGWKSRINFNLR